MPNYDLRCLSRLSLNASSTPLNARRKCGKLFLMDDYPRGFWPSTVDAKGRLKLPAVFQRFLSARAPLTVVYREAEPLRVYPEDTWKRSGGVGLAGSTAMDGEGRILLEKDLREKALINLSETVWLSWHKDRLEIMSNAQYQSLQNEFRVPGLI